MAKPGTITDIRLYGEALIERASVLTLPDLMAPHMTKFIKAHNAYEKAARQVDAARKKRDAALANVAKADDALDPSVLRLADKLAGAGLADRKNPFRAFSRHTPLAVTDLPYAVEAAEVRSIVGKIQDLPPPAELTAILTTCLEKVGVVEKALKALSAPQALYDKAIADRDALLPDWHKALHVLERYGGAAWADEEDTRVAFFAPVERVQRPLPKRKTGSGRTGGKTTPGTTTTKATKETLAAKGARTTKATRGTKKAQADAAVPDDHDTGKGTD